MTLAERLSQLDIDVLWEDLDLGEPPYPLRWQSHGATMTERTMLQQRMRSQLHARGLLEHDGGPTPRIADLLRALARPKVGVDLVFLPDLAGSLVAALAAQTGNQAVLAVQHGSTGDIQLRSITPDTLVDEILRLLPPAQRGTGPSISLPAEDMTGAAEPQPANILRHNSATIDRGGVPVSRTASGQALARFISTPNLGGGQIAVNYRDRAGTPRRTLVLSWCDKASGRYQTTASRNRGDREWITIAPTNTATLREYITKACPPPIGAR